MEAEGQDNIGVFVKRLCRDCGCASNIAGVRVEAGRRCAGPKFTSTVFRDVLDGGVAADLCFMCSRAFIPLSLLLPLCLYPPYLSQAS